MGSQTEDVDLHIVTELSIGDGVVAHSLIELGIAFGAHHTIVFRVDGKGSGSNLSTVLKELDLVGFDKVFLGVGLFLDPLPVEGSAKGAIASGDG